MMKRVLWILLFGMWAASAGAQLADVGQPQPGEVMVRFASDVDQAEAESIAADAGATDLKARYAPQHWLALTATDLDSMLQLVENLLIDARVEAAELNFIGEGGYVPSDPRFAEQWHLRQDTGIDIAATRAWDLSRGDAAIMIAVLDSGIKFDQPEFTGRIAQNPAEIPANGIDEDGNGLVDDVQGWDFVGDHHNPDADPTDEHGHGTWVSSAMAANADGQGVAGVDHQARILPLRVLDADNRGATADLIDAIYYAADMGADILNMSLVNYPVSEMLGDALSAAAGGGAILMACAGNGGEATADSQYPGAHPQTLSIGSTTRTDALAGFSSTGNTVDFAAPGQSILVATHTEPYEDGGEVHNGCSLATPIAAGVVSLMLSVYPPLSQTNAETFLAQSAIDLGLSGWDPQFGWGRIDAAAAVRTADTLFADGFDR